MQITEAMAQMLPNSNSLLSDPKFVQAFLSVAAVPNDPQLSWYFQLEEAMRHLEDIQIGEYVEQLQLVPEMADMISQRYFGSQYKLEDLKENCAPGSLGYAYYHHMTENGIPAYDYSNYESPDDISYVKLRKMQTHDIWHVVAGYNVDLLGELGLQGFYHGQGPSVYQTLLMLALLLHYATIQTKELSLALDVVFEGWERGRKARTLWAVRWEEIWNRPLTELQTELNIPPNLVYGSGNKNNFASEKILSLQL